MPGPCQRPEKTGKHEGNDDTNCSLSPWDSPQRPGNETGRSGDQRKN